MSIKYATILIIFFALLFAGILLTKENSDDQTPYNDITFEKEEVNLRCDNAETLSLLYSIDKSKVRVKALDHNIDVILEKDIVSSNKYTNDEYVFLSREGGSSLEVGNKNVFSNCSVTSLDGGNQMTVSRVGELSDKVVISAPIVNSRIDSPLIIKGLAPGNWFFEATAPVVLTNWDGLIIAEGYITSEEDWMTTKQVPFSGVIEFKVDPNVYSDRGFLILKKSNASGLPERDAAVEVPIYFDLD